MKKKIIEDIESNQTDWWINGRADIVIEILNRICNQDSKIADLGAGVGLISQKIKSAGYKNLTAFDSNPKALSFLRSKGIKSKKLKLPGCSGANKFDVVLLLDVIEHIKKDKKTIIEASKMLNYDGVMIVTVPAFKFLWSKKDDQYGHHRRYTIKSLRKLFYSKRLKPIYLSYYNFFLFPLAYLFAKINKEGDKMNRYDTNRDKILYPIFKFEKNFIGRKIKFPYGVSLLAVIRKK